MKKTGVISFRNRAQVTLFECEMSGQISDGKWENARPYDHHVKPCRAEVTVAVGERDLGCSFKPVRYYQFASRDFKPLAERMIFAVKAVMAFPELAHDYDNHWDWEKNLAAEPGAMDKVNAQVYTVRDLVRDLKDMTAIFKMQKGE